MTFMDEFVDELLTCDHSCDTILPRLTKRYLLEDQGLMDMRISTLEEELFDDLSEEEAVPEVVVEVEEIVKEITLDEIDPLRKTKKKWSSKKVKGLFKVEKAKPKPVEGEGEEDDRPKAGFKDGSLSYHESNILRQNLGLAPLKPPVDYNK